MSIRKSGMASPVHAGKLTGRRAVDLCEACTDDAETHETRERIVAIFLRSRAEAEQVGARCSHYRRRSCGSSGGALSAAAGTGRCDRHLRRETWGAVEAGGDAVAGSGTAASISGLLAGISEGERGAGELWDAGGVGYPGTLRAGFSVLPARQWVATGPLTI